MATAIVAHASTVVLVRSPNPSAIAAEATVRLRGELVSAGFEVQVMDTPIGEDVRASLEKAAAGPGVEAVVAILGDGFGVPLQDSAELWVIDRVTGKTVVRRVPNQPGSVRAAEILSIRALELLRASFLEVALASNRAPKIVSQPAPVDVTRFAEDALVEAWDRRRQTAWGIEVGGCVLGSLGGLPPSLMPLFRVQRSFENHFLARATLAGLGTPSHLNTPSMGTADVTQQFAVVEGAFRFRAEKIIQPMLSIGFGVLHVTAVGQLPWPNQGLDNGRLAFLADIGAGLRMPIRERFEVSVEAHAQAAEPYPTIRFFDVEVAREGRPTLIGSLSLVAWM